MPRTLTPEESKDLRDLREQFPDRNFTAHDMVVANAPEPASVRSGPPADFEAVGAPTTYPTFVRSLKTEPWFAASTFPGTSAGAGSLSEFGREAAELNRMFPDQNFSAADVARADAPVFQPSPLQNGPGRKSDPFTPASDPVGDLTHAHFKTLTPEQRAAAQMDIDELNAMFPYGKKPVPTPGRRCSFAPAVVCRRETARLFAHVTR